MRRGDSTGVVAAGHGDTARAAALMLEVGGNAYDAALAALGASCVAEPVLASLGGGGFLLAQPASGSPMLYDFFTQTPGRRRPPEELDFYPVLVNFGDAQQEFHIGLGAAAVPGVIRGLFQIHRERCRLPLSLILAPARDLARQGARVEPLRHYIATLVEPILRATPAAFALHQPEDGSPRLAEPGERVRQPDFADALEALAAEGDRLFYEGEMGQTLVRDCAERGGHIRAEDLRAYRVERRAPLALNYQDARLLTNPPPALGGLLIGISLHLLARNRPASLNWGEPAHLIWLARAMGRTQELRAGPGEWGRHTEAPRGNDGLGDLLRAYGSLLDEHAAARRGTTHISVLDRAGNLASLTLSNGEGCGYVLPGTGILLNNMLGEADINPHGFQAWPENRRLASMMAPSALCLADGSRVALGSGGSNRIRGAILQVLCNLVDFRLDLEEAVGAPRLHYEDGLLSLEPPRDPGTLAALAREFPNQRLWSEPNLFFGGVHSVLRRPDGDLAGCGDPRRGGVGLLVPGAPERPGAQ